MDIYDTRIEGVITIVAFAPSRASEAFWYRFSVPEHTSGLALGIGRITGEVFRLPDSVRMRLVHVDRDNEQEVDSDLRSGTASVGMSDNGLVSFTSTLPALGEWRLYITHTRPIPFSVQLVLIQRPLKDLVGFMARHRTQTCATAVPAILHALLAKLAERKIQTITFDDLRSDLHELPSAARAFLALSLGVPIASLQDRFDRPTSDPIAGGHMPLTQIIREIWELIQLDHRHGTTS